MGSKKVLTMEEWKQVAKEIHVIRDTLFSLGDILNNLPKTYWLDKHRRVLNRIDQYKADLEDMMFKQQSSNSECTIYLFYPRREPLATPLTTLTDKGTTHIPCPASHLSDPIAAFIQDWVIIEPAGKAFKRDVYQAYCSFCQENGFRALSDGVFSKKLGRKIGNLESGRPRIAGKQVSCWFGIRLREEPVAQVELAPYPKARSTEMEARVYREWLQSPSMQEAKLLYEKKKRENFCPVCNITIPNTKRNRNFGQNALACPKCLTVVNWKGSKIPHHEFQLEEGEGGLGIQYEPQGFGYPWLWHKGCQQGEFGGDKTLGHFRLGKIWIDPDNQLRDGRKNLGARLVLGLRCEQCGLVNCLKFIIYGTPKTIPIYVWAGDPKRIQIIENLAGGRKEQVPVERIKMELEEEKMKNHLDEPLTGPVTRSEIFAKLRQRATGEKYRKGD